MKIIVNGGDPLSDCPTSADEANLYLEELNKNPVEGMEWSFDCGYKLDYDGQIVKILSRFYPPKEFYGNFWDGYVKVYLLDEKIITRKFQCEKIQDLKKEVEAFVNSTIEQIKNSIKTIK